jgi:hypothetical protein
LKNGKDSVSYVWIDIQMGSSKDSSILFHPLKRMFGKCVLARKYSNMVKEMMLKASLLYNTIITRK